jgi:hypothetical protein
VGRSNSQNKRRGRKISVENNQNFISKIMESPKGSTPKIAGRRRMERRASSGF